MRRAVLVFACLLLFGGAVRGQASAAKRSLDDVMFGSRFAGSEEARQLLLSQGFVVTDENFRQIFTPYIDAGMPVFITTDSAWHTYQFLLGWARAQMQTAEAELLRHFSRRLAQAALEKADGEGPYRDLALFAAVGLALQDRQAVEELPEGVRTDVEAALDALTGCCPTRVLFFGLKLAPDRFEEPGGCHAARQWYALCDFRLRSDAETARAIRLAQLIWSDAELKDMWTTLSEPGDLLVGPPDCGDVESYVALAREAFGEPLPECGLEERLGKFRALARQKLPEPVINDQALNIGRAPGGLRDSMIADEIRGFRLLPPRRLPSELLFRLTTWPAVKGRVLPSGLDVTTVGPLASKAGRRALRPVGEESGTGQADLSDLSVELPDSLHGKALEALRLLQQPLAPSAPAPLRTSVWTDRQLWTQLGGWLEQAHGVRPGPKSTARHGRILTDTGGSVSPYPEFFSALAELCREAAGVLSELPLAGAMDTRRAGRRLLEIAAMAKRTAREGWEPPPEQQEALRWFWQAYVGEQKLPTPGQVAARMEPLESLGRKCAEGERPTEDELGVLHMLRSTPEDVPALLRELAGICDELARIAGRQLAGEALTPEDGEFIGSYGRRIARLHLYAGDSWLDPEDDFPFVQRAFVGVGRDALHAGLARPEALYLILGTDEQPVLHRGAVLSYREFAHSRYEDLTDAGWRERLDSLVAPPPPAFTSSFRAGITQGAVAEIIRAGEAYAALESIPGDQITEALIGRLHQCEPDPECWWARRHVFRRAEDQHLPDLIALMKQTSNPIVGYYAVCIGRLNWQPQKDEITQLLYGDSTRLNDAGAYILSRRPEEIPVGELLEKFDAQPVRTRRVFCYLLARAPEPGERVADTLLTAVQSAEPGLRYTAIRAVEQAGLDRPRVLDAMTERLQDENEFVAAAAAHCLREFGVREAAPAILEALRRVGPPSISEEQKQAVFGDALYAGALQVMVLSDVIPEQRRRAVGLLGTELIEAVGRFRCEPAADLLVALVDEGYGVEALRALAKVYPDGHLDRALQIATDTSRPPGGRLTAVRHIAAHRERGMVSELLPLLEDATTTEEGPPAAPWTIAEGTAVAVADLLGWEHQVSPRSKVEERRDLVSRVRKWAGDQQAR